LKSGLKICQECTKIEDSGYMEEFSHENFVFIILFYLFIYFYIIIFNLSLFQPFRHCFGVYFII
jgi:hypothetical protein